MDRFNSLTSSVYLENFYSEPCQVCGENASGWHCGSITWFAYWNIIIHLYIKFDFLVKHVKNFFFDQSMENILNINVFEINNVWLHVQHELNVNFVVIQNVFQLAWRLPVLIFFLYFGFLLILKYLEENSNPKIEEIFKEIPCAVCQSASSGMHFGATTCEVRLFLIYFSILFFIIFRDVKDFFVEW